MRIFTSYISFWKKYKRLMPEPVMITAIKPDWWTGLWRPDLAPNKDDLFLYKNKSITWEQLEQSFIHKIEKREPSVILKSLPENCILLCWEKKGSPCHRHTLAEYLNKDIDEKITEFRVLASAYNTTGVPVWFRKPL